MSVLCDVAKVAPVFGLGFAENYRLIPVEAQVAPCWVVGDDESNFLQAGPAFQFFLAGDAR